MALLQRTAMDMTSASGCRRCADGRDAVSGWGRLNIAAAVGYPGRLAPIDRTEPNDDAGARSFRVRKPTVNRNASLDFWDDQNDVYAVRLRRGGRLVATLSRATANVSLVLWKPGTQGVNKRRSLANVAAQSVSFGRNNKVVRFGLRSRIRRAGIYYLQVSIMEPGATSYTLRTVRR